MTSSFECPARSRTASTLALGGLRTGTVFGEMLHVILPAVLKVAVASLVHLRRDSLARLLGRRT